MLPVNFFDRSLISDAIRERQRSVRSHRRRGHTSLGSPATAGLRQREWDRANRQQQKQVKGASKNLRFDRRVNLFFHFFGPRELFRLNQFSGRFFLSPSCSSISG
jgi:hypothetical protein